MDVVWKKVRGGLNSSFWLLFGFLGFVEFFVGVWVFSAKKVLFDVLN